MRMEAGNLSYNQDTFVTDYQAPKPERRMLTDSGSFSKFRESRTWRLDLEFLITTRGDIINAMMMWR